MVAAHRLYHPVSGDFVWITNAAERSAAVAQYGYVDQGADFAVSSVDDACLVPVVRFARGSIHRFAVTAADQQALAAAGWVNEGVQFFAAPATGTALRRHRHHLRPRRLRRDQLPVGQANYAAPANAVYASPSGNDANAGTAAAPVRTVGPRGRAGTQRAGPSCCAPVAIARR